MAESGAEIEGPYRYRLWRRWAHARAALFVMLNPSTADAEADDPTIRRCRAFAVRWGYGGIDIVNLFAYRATDPRELVRVGEGAVGPRNDERIVHAAMDAGVVVAAWGARGWLLGRDRAVLPLLEAAWNGRVTCLGLTKAGHPRHPLYVRADTPLQRFG